MSITGPYSSGWPCGACGAWVPNGCVHSCTNWQTQSPPAVRWDRMTDVRIADALERIAAALEAAAQAGDSE